MLTTQRQKLSVISTDPLISFESSQLLAQSLKVHLQALCLVLFSLLYCSQSFFALNDCGLHLLPDLLRSRFPAHPQLLMTPLNSQKDHFQ